MKQPKIKNEREIKREKTIRISAMTDYVYVFVYCDGAYN